MTESGSDKRRITLELSEDLLRWIDGLKSQMGYRSRGPMVEQLLRELLPDLEDAEQADPSATTAQVAASPNPAVPKPVQTGSDSAGDDPAEAPDPFAGELDENSAIVLIGADLVSLRDRERGVFETAGTGDSLSSLGAGGGIQLPGFVRRQARAVKRSLSEQAQPQSEERSNGLALIPADALQDALLRAQQHWLEIYGQPPSDAAQDAALTWLARDVWPQSDHSDGRPFSWGLAQQVLLSFAPSWPIGEPSLDRCITAAGILEDPFGGNSLAVRVPTLITRFVQRQRSRQKRTTSFEAIDQSMSVHGALRLLQLPTIAERPYTLKEIRDAYREQAQSHHPDAGGSADAMRRLNEAYQFLKERYRRAA